MRATLLSLLLALPLFAEYRFEPPVPTDRSAVVLQIREIWRDGCVPRNETITRSGNAFTVRYEIPKGVTCPAATAAWDADAYLGALPAGVYTVTVQVDDFDGLRTTANLTLVVTEAAPLLSITPRLASTAGGTEITVRNICSGTVLVDGVTVPVRAETNCSLTATLPTHAPGPVNVRVLSGERAFDMINAVHYVDPAAAPDPSLYERVLVPVLFHGPGAFNSRWETEVVMTDLSPRGLGALPAVSAPLRSNTSLRTLFGDRAAGLVLFIPRGHDVRFSSHIRDVSRDASQWGTEMPIVRESEGRQRIILQNVPFDPRYRLQLRMYGIDGVAMPLIVSSGILNQSVILRGPCTATPCNSSEPAYASVDLRQLFPELAGTRMLIIDSLALQSPRHWAFVTVTNNESQHVTVISPQ